MMEYQQDLFLTIIACNNKGVDLLHDGNVKMSVKYFSKALQLSNRVLSFCNDQQQNHHHRTYLRIDDWMEGASIDDDNDSSPSSRFVYSRPIHIPASSYYNHVASSSSCTSSDDATMTDETTEEQDNRVMVAATIVFNLALAFLLQGQLDADDNNGPCSNKRNEKSLKLFQCALQLVEQAHDTSGVTLFGIAALSNIRFLYERLGQLEDANTCHQRLSNFLVGMMMMAADNNTNGQACCGSTSSFSKYEGFFRLLIDPTSCSTCAGAA